MSHVFVCCKISFNCTLIAHENVTTEFCFNCFTFILAVWGLFRFILIWHKFCLVVFVASQNAGPSENVSPPMPRVSRQTRHSDVRHRPRFHRRVQVEHTELENHYNTLNGYCDHHEPPPPHTHGSKARACVCALARRCTTLAKISPDVRECVSVFCVYSFRFPTGMEVSLANAPRFSC